MADSENPTIDPQHESQTQTTGHAMAIVGVGVCAASLKSLGQLFSALSTGIGATYLIAVRQQEGLNVNTVVDVLTEQSPFIVKIAEDGERLEPNHVYVSGPNDLLTIEDGHIRATMAIDPIGHRGTIDSMLVSLAEEANDRAIAVILAGLGNDGTAGITASKKFGGLSIAETLAGAAGDAQAGMGPVPVVDLHLPLDKIPAQIALYAASIAQVSDGPEQESIAAEIETQVTQITTILRNATGHDFHGYKRGTFVRRVHRRMQVLQVEGMDNYLARLRSDHDEVQNLFQDLLIGVTQFFRDPAEFEALEREIPRLFEGKQAGDQFRVWVLGCATGEEAYSIAILLREHMATLDHPPEVQIFATDLDARALGLARAGRYAAESIVKHIAPHRLDRWFIREGNTYCVSKELREMCIFSPHNIVKDAPFSRVDILSCRNLLIYLNADLQNRVIPIFHFALKSGGVLFLGTSENVTRQQKLFAPVDRKNRLFRRLETATRTIPDFTLWIPHQSRTPPGTELVPVARIAAPLSAPVSRQAEAVAERYAPAFVVVDREGDILHFSGRTGRYFEPSAGAASLNVVNLVHRDLRLDLRSALQRATADARRIELPRLRLEQDDRTYGLNLIVEPVGGPEITSVVIVFQDTGVIPDHSDADGDRLATDEQVERLEAELRVTRDRLQATIEELESTNEELKSSNEEYQSINEELQSANEEMETSKEELQSMNEELQTVNGELAHRVGELASTNSDIKNLLESTQISTVFLDNTLRVRNFTPAATDIFHLLETDVGRPLDHVVSRVDYPDLPEDIRRVLKTLTPIERSVVDPSTGRHYACRVLPYRSIDNYIGGAVVTFTDLTAVRTAEMALRESEESYQVLFDSIDEGFCVIEVSFDANGNVTDYRFVQANPAFESQTGLTDVVGKTMRELAPAHEESWYQIFGQVAVTGEPARFEDEAAALGRWYDVYAFRAGKPEQRRVAVLFRDVLERRRAEQSLRDSEERFRQFGEASQDVLWIRDAETFQWEYLTPAFETIYGLDRSAALSGDNMAGWVDLIVPEDRARAIDDMRRVRDGEQVSFEFRIRRPSDGEIRWLRNTDFPIEDGAGSVIRIGGIGHDITQLKQTEEALAEVQLRQKALIEGIPQLVWRAAEPGKWTWASPQWAAYTGQGEQDSHGWGWLDVLHPDDRDIARDAWMGAPDTAKLEIDCRIYSTERDSFRWFQTRAAPVRDKKGTIIEWLGTSTDIDDIRNLQESQKVLVAELQHRTRNLMGIVRSVAEKTSSTSANLDDFRMRFRDRLDALARVQGLLSRLNDHDRVTFDELIHSELSAMDENADRVKLQGPLGVRLRSSMVQTLAMAIHELATNAVKYGALSQPQALLEVTWRLEKIDDQPLPRLRIDWKESGVDMHAPRDKTNGGGQGRELIERALPYQLKAKTTYSLGPDGVHCTIDVGVSNLMADEEVQDEGATA